MRESFDRELQRLEAEIIRMGSEVEEHLTQVTAALVERDAVTARRMIEMCIRDRAWPSPATSLRPTAGASGSRARSVRAAASSSLCQVPAIEHRPRLLTGC